MGFNESDITEDAALRGENVQIRHQQLKTGDHVEVQGITAAQIYFVICDHFEYWRDVDVTFYIHIKGILYSWQAEMSMLPFIFLVWIKLKHLILAGKMPKSFAPKEVKGGVGHYLQLTYMTSSGGIQKFKEACSFNY